MTTEAKLLLNVQRQLSVIRTLIAETGDALDDTIRLLASTRPSSAESTTSPTPLESGVNRSSSDQPLREQLSYEGKPIPAPGADAGDIVARARAFFKKQKSSKPECTESE